VGKKTNMPYDPFKHPTGTLRSHRRSIRLRGYDYASAGAYFVTIVAQNREYLFGKIADEEMHVNDAGQMILRWWEELAHKFPSVELDEYVAMPNHFHGIVVITEDDVGANTPGADVGADLRVRPQPEKGAHAGAPQRDDAPQHKPALGEIIQWFKTMTTNEYIRGVNEHGWQPFSGKLWQRNYYEHIIRSERDLERIREYIAKNPSAWTTDTENRRE